VNPKLRASLRRLLLAAALAPALPLSAQSPASAPAADTLVLPDYVHTATRTPAALTTTGTAVDTISAADLARMQLTGLNAVLTGIPGAPAAASGAPGSITSLFLRGSNSNQTLFLVDGIRANDANTDYQVVLGGACLGACDNLEVSHGPQSTLYGGEAVGGVIAIRGQRGSGPARGRVAFEAGSFGTIQGAASAQAGDGRGGYTFSVNGGHTDNDRPNNEFDSTTYALRVDRRLSARVAVGATWRGFIGTYGSPGAAIGWGANDPDNEERESNQLATVFAEFTPSPEVVSKAVLGGQHRRYESFDGAATTLVKNRRAVLDWQTTWTASEQHRLTGGLTAEVNHTRNTGFGDINESQQLLALFVQDEWTPVERVFLTAGVRSDDHDTYGRATTGRVTAAWLSPDSRWKLRGSYGTAFRSPSFLDLYGQSAYYVGNPNLGAEKGRGWDAGVDYFLADRRGVLSATWFDTRITNLITFDFAAFPSTVRNVGRARTRGLEVSGKATLPGAVEVRLAYAYLEADDLDAGARLLRRPRQSGSLDLWRTFGRWSAGAGLVFVNDRMDVHAETYATIRGEDYAVVRLYGAWQLTERLALRARVENLFDEQYEQVHGYPQLGRGAFGGVEWRF
jgi:vitamin B12 transporter